MLLNVCVPCQHFGSAHELEYTNTGIQVSLDAVYGAVINQVRARNT